MNEKNNIYNSKSIEATVLISDIKDFTKITEDSSPKSIIRLLNDFYLETKKIANNNLGIVTNFIGDGALIVFGAPSLTYTHSFDAIRSSIEMIKSVSKLSKELNLRIGIATGKVIYGLMDNSLGIIIAGNVPRFASKLCKLNKIFYSNILISETTYKYVGDLIKVKEFERKGVIPDFPGINSIYEVLEIIK